MTFSISIKRLAGDRVANSDSFERIETDVKYDEYMKNNYAK